MILGDSRLRHDPDNSASDRGRKKDVRQPGATL